MPNTTRSPLPRGSSSSSVTTANGMARSQSIRGNAREAVKRPSPNTSILHTNTNVSDDEEDARAERNSKMEELKTRVLKAETASEEYQRQLNTLQTRLDDSFSQQGKLEDQLAEATGKTEELENDKTQGLRYRREMENRLDAERAAYMTDKEEQKARAEELEAVNQRLKDMLAQREVRSNVDENTELLRSGKSKLQ